MENKSAKAVLQANLKAWMTYAADHKMKTGSFLGLETASGISRMTIKAIVKGESAPAVDTVHAIAQAFGLEAWQLLVPGIAPPTRAALGDADWLEAEIQRRTKAEVAHILKEMAALHGEEGRDGRAPSKPFAVGPVATIESSGRLQDNAPGTARKQSAAKRKCVAKTQKGA
ncbi:MAG: helix-turn-helix transcriptional regulator [Burkholderiales bacterium]|nr:helix-turn-helix transcriptional regulator [Burkholderiales bacterium]